MCYAVRSYFESLLCSLSLCICRLGVKGPLKAFSSALQRAWDETSDKSPPFLWAPRHSWPQHILSHPWLCFPARCCCWARGAVVTQPWVAVEEHPCAQPLPSLLPAPSGINPSGSAVRLWENHTPCRYHGACSVWLLSLFSLGCIPRKIRAHKAISGWSKSCSFPPCLVSPSPAESR